MFKSDENKLGQTNSKPSRMQGSENCRRKFGQEIRPNNRRVLSIINQNLNVATSNYPCVVNKRGFPENHHGICGKNQPITRNSSAALSCPEEEMSKRLKASDENFIYVDEEKASKDHTEPMFMEQAEDVAEKETLHHMEEVEMEDIFEEAILDIDGCDANNPLAAVEYVDDMYAYYKRMESCSCVPSNYMAQQFDINERMRSILIDWLIEVQHKFELRDETLFLTVNLIDRFLSQQPVMRKKLQLVGLIAMLLACKYEEVSVPVVEDLIFISDKAYNRKEVLQMESLMLNTLQFNLSLPTQYVFMRRFLKASQSDKKLEHMAFFLMELCLVEYEMLRFSPSLLAAAAIYTAHCTLYGFSQWNKTCEWHTNYNEDQLQECSRLIVGLHQRAGTGKLTGVYRKYISSKFGFTAKSEPALFILAKTQQVL